MIISSWCIYKFINNEQKGNRKNISLSFSTINKKKIINTDFFKWRGLLSCINISLSFSTINKKNSSTLIVNSTIVGTKVFSPPAQFFFPHHLDYKVINDCGGTGCFYHRYIELKKKKIEKFKLIGFNSVILK
jgi:hypothetical protein